jgi:hypothetical protein
LTIGQMLVHWEKTGKVPADKINLTRTFLKGSDHAG